MLIDADRWLRGTGLPYWTVAKLREMKVGEVLSLVDFEGPGITGALTGSARVVVERKRGYWSFSALWLLYVGRNAFRRGTLWAPDVHFRVKPGRTLEFIGNDDGSDYILQVLRRCRHLAKWAKDAGDRKAYVAMLPFPVHPSERASRDKDAVEWLFQMNIQHAPQTDDARRFYEL